MSKSAEQLSESFREHSDKTSEHDKSKEFAMSRLGLTPEQLERTAGLTGSDKIMMMLLLWKQTRKRPYSKLSELTEGFIEPCI